MRHARRGSARQRTSHAEGLLAHGMARRRLYHRCILGFVSVIPPVLKERGTQDGYSGYLETVYLAWPRVIVSWATSRSDTESATQRVRALAAGRLCGTAMVSCQKSSARGCGAGNFRAKTQRCGSPRVRRAKVARRKPRTSGSAIPPQCCLCIPCYTVRWFEAGWKWCRLM